MFKSSLESTRAIALLLVHLSSAIGLFSLSGFLKPVVLFPFVLLYLIGVFFDYKGFYPVRRLILNIFAIALSLYFIVQASLEDLITPFASLVTLMLAIKSLEEKKARDLYQMLLLSLLAIATSTAFNISISFLPIFLLHVYLSILALIFINLFREHPKGKLSISEQRLYVGAGSVLFVMVFLFSIPFFYLLPRTQTPLFNLVSHGSGLKSGLSENVELGKVGEIQEDNSVVMRVFDLPESIKDPYWRAFVFDSFNGKLWLRGKEEVIKTSNNPSADFVYTVVLEPGYSNIVPALDYPVMIESIQGVNARGFLVTGNSLRLDREILRSVKLKLKSGSKLAVQESPDAYLQVPESVPKGIKLLANDLSKDAKDKEEKLKRVTEHFSKGFAYSKELGPYQGDPLEYFLFVSKRANCEYYASATALLLGGLGVRARVVGGFKGALYNPYGKYHVVTNSMAHVWVEAYVKGEWIRVDTTPSYSPEAIREISKFSLLHDYIVSFWHTNVIGFDAKRQISLFRGIKEGLSRKSSFESVSSIFEPLMLMLLGMSGFYFLLQAYFKSRKTPENLYRELKWFLKSKGLISDEFLPEHVLTRVLESPYYDGSLYIIRLYQRKRFSQHKVYKNEIIEGYKILQNLKNIAGRS
ncbi:MAG: DUF3488 and transglutaminase-like domain-containing protein [Aquificaceae bacterium]|nr:DUF3488 and transglutaminase-like domain-containing protein [Aquificaceae bacterium]